MAAPKGNQFWKLRSKHGRDKLFETPELLWKAACEYYQWCDENPLIEAQIVKGNWSEETSLPVTDKEGKTKNVKSKVTHNHSLASLPKMRAYTITGLCLYLDCSTEYFRHFEDNNKNSKSFMPVITRIRETIYNQKFTGSAANLLNANIISRDLGLVDKNEQRVITEQPLFGEE